MDLKPSEVTSVLKKEIEGFSAQMRKSNVGTVLQVGDGVARVHGLDDCMMSELLEFPGDVYGLALNLEEDNVGVVLFGSDTAIKEGDTVKTTGRIISVPTGLQLCGRVVDALGRPIDGKGPIQVQDADYRPIEGRAPTVPERQPVKEPLQTGIKAIDSMIPIGRGQRELIIGDRSTGKTALCVDTILNQRSTGGGDPNHQDQVICIYVAVGQKQSTVKAVVQRLEEFGALDYTIVVSAPASSEASMQYLSCYAGAAMGERLRDEGRHVVIFYDDLYKQALAYRQVMLLLRRPPGREAFPGDVFNLHSRLLERAAKLRNDWIIVRKDAPEDTTEGVDGKVYHGVPGEEEAKEKLAELGGDHELRKLPGSGGSLTALPVIETQAGDISTYIPTNVISITDGQIYLETDMFHSGVRPAINAGLSVSRVGGSAQIPAMKKVAGTLRLELAQYRELAAFAQFGSDLDKATQAQLARGQRLTEVLKQGQYSPLPVANQIVIIFAATNGYLDRVPVERVQDYEKRLHEFMNAQKKDVLELIERERKLTDEVRAAITAALDGFGKQYAALLEE